MDLSFIPSDLWPTIKTVGGALLFALGVSYSYKFFQASFLGNVNYWSGLDNFSWIFAPITSFVTPFLCHTPATGKSLIKTQHAAWVHLLWGPIFFLAGLMCLVAGADFMGLPGTQAMNYVLTFGRPDVPPAIVYSPPFTYKFPVLKTARKSLFKLLTADIAWDKSKSMLEEKETTGTTNAQEEEDDGDVPQFPPAPPPPESTPPPTN